MTKEEAAQMTEHIKALKMLSEKLKTEIENMAPLSEERKLLAWYKIQVGNHIRRITFNCNEAIDYLEFLSGAKEVK